MAAALLFCPRVLLPGKTIRRRRPSDADWPSKAEWKRLNSAVDGNLIPVEFPLDVCKKDVNSATCQSLLANLQNPYYIGDQPGLTQTLGWVGAWWTKPSVYAVAARSASHIASAVNFARDNNLRLVVKGGGHSYQGTSNAPDSLLIWTRHMNEIAMHEAFIAKGCEGIHRSERAVTLGAGAIWMQAYDAVTTRGGAYVQGGGCTTVGVAGLIQSGGLGSFSKRYGTAAANLLEAEVVTADGQIRIANARMNPDLFWALKGGGGGSFGVVSKVTLRVHALPDYFGGVGFTVKAATDRSFQRLLRRFVSFYGEALMNERWGEQAHIRSDNSLEISMVSSGVDARQARKIWNPFLHWLARFPGAYALEGEPIIGSAPARGWWDSNAWKRFHYAPFIADSRPGALSGNVWWKGDADQVGWTIYGFESLWLSASLLEDNSQERLTRGLFAGSRHRSVSLHFNKGLAGAPREALEATKDTATNPALLNAFALAIVADGGHGYPGVRGEEPDAAAARASAERIHRCMDELRLLSPNGGSYVSESSYFEKGWPRSYWGSNYPRLASVKEKYDPSGLFFVHNGVGSEDWSKDGFTKL